MYETSSKRDKHICLCMHYVNQIYGQRIWIHNFERRIILSENVLLLSIKLILEISREKTYKILTYHCSPTVIFHSFCFDNTFKNQINHFLVPEPRRATNKFKINLNRIDNQKTSTTEICLNQQQQKKVHVLKHWYWVASIQRSNHSRSQQEMF